MKKDQKKAKLFKDMSFKWREFRLQEETDKINEAIDKRGLQTIADSFARVLSGNDSAALATLKNKKLQGVVRKHINQKNFDEAYKVLFEELFRALYKASIMINDLGDN